MECKKEPNNQKNDQIRMDRFRVLMEGVADGFYETDLRGNFTFFNKGFCSIFGRDPEELQNTNFRVFMDRENSAIAFDNFNRIFHTETGTTNIKWEILRKDGERRFLEVSGNIIYNDEGLKQGFRGIARDITESFLAQKALEESRQEALRQFRASRRADRRNRLLLEFLPEPVFVFNSDGTVSYINPAFEKVFGWTLAEVRGKRIPFVPKQSMDEARQGVKRLFRDNVVHDYETRRLTKDGRILDVLLDASIYYEKGDREPSGQIVIFRDITKQKRSARINEALFTIARALPGFRKLERRLGFIIPQVKELLNAEGASVILVDEEAKEFYFPAVSYEDKKANVRMKEIRFPMEKGVAGEVYRAKKPLIVPDTSKCPLFFHTVDEESGYKTRNIMDVPIMTQDRVIGVLCAVNKKEGVFNEEDMELLGTIASTVAFSIENAMISAKLNESYREVQILNRAKERVLHHLSHELKTPVSVLDASLTLLEKKLKTNSMGKVQKIMERAKRSLNRILGMQYEIEDILHDRDYKTYYMLSAMIDSCADELSALAALEAGRDDPGEKIREKILSLFGPKETKAQSLRPDTFIKDKLRSISPCFFHRKIDLKLIIEETGPIFIPPDVLDKIIEGLVRNAAENTPDHGVMEVRLSAYESGCELLIRDYGVGITEENMPLIFESNITTRETMSYSSGERYAFNAGGKGFDLLRMKIFSERFNFHIGMVSSRCGFIPRDEDICPGDVNICPHVGGVKGCMGSGGTAVSVKFPYYAEEKNE